MGKLMLHPVTLSPCHLVTLLCLLLLASSALAQIPAPRLIPPPRVIQDVGIDNHLGEQVPMDLVFRNEAGEAVTLESLVAGKPVVLSLVYYECPMLCTATLNDMGRAFKPLKFDIGREFNVITVSFDPSETPAMAAAKKRSYLKQYNREGAEAGWHFLTGDAESVSKLAQAVGFRYHYDENTKQYAHSAGIMVLTPTGKIARYFHGLEYSTRDLQLGLVEASHGKIGKWTDQAMLLCFQYDPMSGRYGFAIMTSLRIGAVLTLLALGGFVTVMIRRERRKMPVEKVTG